MPLNSYSKGISPSRTYVAMCESTGFDRYYFRSFTLPETDPWSQEVHGLVPNTAEFAAWYFLNRLNFDAYILCCFPIEDYQDLQPQD